MFKLANQSEMDRYERAVDSAIATCGGDLRGALKALIIANEFLEEELRQILRTISYDPDAAPASAPHRDVA